MALAVGHEERLVSTVASTFQNHAARLERTVRSIRYHRADLTVSGYVVELELVVHIVVNDRTVVRAVGQLEHLTGIGQRINPAVGSRCSRQMERTVLYIVEVERTVLNHHRGNGAGLRKLFLHDRPVLSVGRRSHPDFTVDIGQGDIRLRTDLHGAYVIGISVFS